MKPNESKAASYATHGLSLVYGPCHEKGHKCTYCYNKRGRMIGASWNVGDLRINPKAEKMAQGATPDMKVCMQFTGDPFPNVGDQEYWFNHLVKVCDILEARKVPFKVLTKNANIIYFLDAEIEPYRFGQLGCSLTTDMGNRTIQRIEEPGASPIEDRFHSLMKLFDEGWRTWASAEPILYGTNLERFFIMLDTLDLEEVYIGLENYDKDFDDFIPKDVIRAIDSFNWVSDVEVQCKKQLEMHRCT